MKTSIYKRGKYNIRNRKESKVSFFTDKLMKEKLKQLADAKNKNISLLIREAIEACYFN